MQAIHTAESVLEVCRILVSTHGTEGLTRSAVQAALRERAVAEGQPPVGADNAAVGKAMRAAREEDRLARLNAAGVGQVAAMADVCAVPGPLSTALERHVVDIQGIVRRILSDAAQRAEADARQRVAAVEADAARRLAAIEADYAIAEADGGTLAMELDAVQASLAACERVLQRRESALETSESARVQLEADSRRQIAGLTDELREALGQRGRAEDDRRAAIERQQELEHACRSAHASSDLDRDRRYAVETARDKALERVSQQMERVTTLEGVVAEAEGRLASTLAECERLRSSLAVAEARFGVVDELRASLGLTGTANMAHTPAQGSRGSRAKRVNA